MNLQARVVSHVDYPWHLLLIDEHVEADNLEGPPAKLKVILARHCLVLDHRSQHLHNLAHSRVDVRFELLNIDFAASIEGIPQRGKGAFAIVVCLQDVPLFFLLCPVSWLSHRLRLGLGCLAWHFLTEICICWLVVRVLQKVIVSLAEKRSTLLALLTTPILANPSLQMKA